MVYWRLTDPEEGSFRKTFLSGTTATLRQRNHAATPPSQPQQPQPHSCRARIHDRQPVEGPRVLGAVFGNHKLTLSKSTVCLRRVRQGILDSRPYTMQHTNIHKTGRPKDTRDVLRTYSSSLHEILRFPPKRRESRSRLPLPRHRLYLTITHTSTPQLSKASTLPYNLRVPARNVDHTHGHAQTPRSLGLQPPHRCLFPTSLHFPNPRCDTLSTSRDLSSSTAISTLQNPPQDSSITTRVAGIRKLSTLGCGV